MNLLHIRSVKSYTLTLIRYNMKRFKLGQLKKLRPTQSPNSEEHKKEKKVIRTKSKYFASIFNLYLKKNSNKYQILNSITFF